MRAIDVVMVAIVGGVVYSMREQEKMRRAHAARVLQAEARLESLMPYV